MGRYRLLFVIAITILGIQSGRSDSLSNMTNRDESSALAKEVKDNSRYKTLEANAIMSKLLVDDKDGVSRSEVFDMLHSRDDSPDNFDLPTFPEDVEDMKSEVPGLPDSQAEFLQVADSEVRKDSQKLRRPAKREEPVGLAAGIMVIVTCSIVFVAYSALIIWRRIYLKRNGLKHELLRNEEVVAETRLEL
uniref:Uncharacterized protein n=1 Tax=Bombyx mori TaxID=7091 RepID=A0A8R2ALH7_BOMMO|nr:uncharacterized protein LOC101744907 [Bombyx mori]XP_004931146.1 uncharacterized protein LOC101744907 [Bombyx mori]XP_021206919.1 uncharacterized protein LOC101744907 [Bombyx mori]